MKKIRLFLSAIFFAGYSFAQSASDWDAPTFPVTDNTGTVVFAAGSLSEYVGGSLMAFSGGVPVSEPSTVALDGSGGVAPIGSDNLCNCDLAVPGEELTFAILIDGTVVVIADLNPPLTYAANMFSIVGNGTVLTFSVGGAPVVFGCTDADYLDYIASANVPDGSCTDLIVEGCMEPTACNFNSDANKAVDCTYTDGVCDTCEDGVVVDNDLDDDNSCFSYETYTIDSLNAVLEEVIISLSSMQLALDSWNTTIDLAAGWNMFGYGCPAPIDLVEALSDHTDNIIILKDNNGKPYMPEFGYNGMGDFIPGHGYQIKVTEAVEGFSLCDWYVNDIPEDHIVSLQEENASMKAELDSLYGCMDEGACNFDPTAVLNDSSCDYAEEGYDCQGNEITSYQVGDLAYGGMVFYVDETGQHGLVAAMEDLTDDATDPWGWGFNGYEWGCSEESVNGADGQAIGTGYQNSLDIVNQGCTTENGGITAAQATLDVEINGYSDWHLPSIDELLEMYNTIGNGGSEGNIGGFETDVSPYYWSSSEDNFDSAWCVSFVYGNSYHVYLKDSTYRVRVIRAF